MTLIYADRVQETFTTTGTGSVSLLGPITAYQAFGPIVGDGNTCYYTATDGTNWETGLATYTAAGNTLTRTTIYESSNSNSAVNWGAGTKNIWLDLPAFAINTFTGGITLGTTSLTGGAAGKILYDNGGSVEEYAISGTGSVAMTNSPSFTTPDLGTPAAGDLSNCTGIPGSLMTPLGVGSIVFAKTGSFFTANTNYAGSGLTVQQVGQVASGVAISASGDTLTGVWKALSSGTNGFNAGLFQRVS